MGYLQRLKFCLFPLNMDGTKSASSTALSLTSRHFGSAVDFLKRELHAMGVDGDGLGAVVRLVDADQPVCQLKHVVT